jgi:hypothetical protein
VGANHHARFGPDDATVRSGALRMASKVTAIGRQCGEPTPR